MTKINIDDLTLGQIKEIQKIGSEKLSDSTSSNGLNDMIGKKCIVRTYVAGVWFGEIEQKSGKEVILKNARRMWRWHTKESISLSSVAMHGVDSSKSKIAMSVPSVWLEAIELMPCADAAIKSIGDCENAKSN